MYIEEFFGFIALVTTIVGLLPQVYKAHVTKLTRDISMLMLINCLLCSLSWLGYGLCQGSLFVISSNIAASVVSIVSIIQKCYYDAKSSRSTS